ncbi:DUF5906 domain-containing protein [Moraxella bovis]|uniref:DUF5906 domain-containing protein n=1 Tax=Moraxella bovis TaxID=476 RepID=UPI00227A4B49|nr:DUF5906 domain-containing protein [Moraxella bovis]WAJ74558.1 DUF5906 domain-containing protein [Moraxella bovis]WAJ74811.1 DUF5906 domain-containing protein [Moraxella bovis]
MNEKRLPLDFDYIKVQATGHWLSRIFPAVGIKLKGNGKKHQSCPCCGGKDRFRCDDKQGNGTWICNNCGAGNGIDLVIKYTGQSVRDAYEAVAGVLGIDGGRAMSDADKAKWQADKLAREQKEKQNKKLQWKKVADTAFNRFISAQPIMGKTHPYLDKKGIGEITATGNAGVKLDKWGNLLIPLYFHNYKTGVKTLCNIQSIDKDGKKLFIKDGLVGGAFCVLGNPNTCDTLLICEGYATGASLLLATGGQYAIIVSFNAKNMEKVAPTLRQLYPTHRLLFCGDDDKATAQKTGKNDGIHSATASAQMTGGAWISPNFKGDTRTDTGELTDFNDLHLAFGLGEVATQISNALANYQAVIINHAPQNAPTPQNQAVAESQPVTKPNTDKEPVKPTLAPADSEKLKTVLKDFAKIVNNGKMSNKVYDLVQKMEYTKTQFAHKVGKKVADAFFLHDTATIEQSDVDNQRRGKADQNIGGMLDRYALIFGTKEIWDNKLKTRFLAETIRMAHPNEFDVWLKSPSRATISPENIWFDPSDDKRPAGIDSPVNGKDYINSFAGLALNGLDDDGLTYDECYTKAKPITDLLLHLCNSDHAIFVWVMRWLAIPLQNLGTKMDTALIFHGALQGAGKSMFFDKVMSAIYGEYAVTLGQGQLEEQYNEWVVDKMYAVFEEIFSGKDRYAHMGKIKQLITGNKIYISKKYSNGWVQDNYVNCVFLSNDIMPLQLDQGDRRFMVVNPSQLISSELRQAVSDALDDPHKTVIRAFLAVLMNYDLGEQNAHTHPPITKAKERLIGVSMPSWERFFRDWQAGHLPISFGTALSQKLYNVYKMYCHRNGDNAVGENKFSIYITAQQGIEKKRVWYNQQGNRKQGTCIIVGDVGQSNGSVEAWLGYRFYQFQNEIERSDWYS